jgi:cell wall assembly regulator SMI1
MKSLKVIERYEPASNDQINKFESDFGVKLPCDYKLFLATQNIYLTKENYFSGQEVHHFYPLHDEAELSLTMIFEALGEHFENSFVPFADDSGGWQYVISLRDADYGKVYFCRMDEELQDALTLLADSFTEFINGLRAEEEIA